MKQYRTESIMPRDTGPGFKISVPGFVFATRVDMPSVTTRSVRLLVEQEVTFALKTDKSAAYDVLCPGFLKGKTKDSLRLDELICLPALVF